MHCLTGLVVRPDQINLAPLLAPFGKKAEPNVVYDVPCGCRTYGPRRRMERDSGLSGEAYLEWVWLNHDQFTLDPARASCWDCQGKGVIKSSHNPNALWSNWLFGGYFDCVWHDSARWKVSEALPAMMDYGHALPARLILPDGKLVSQIAPGPLRIQAPRRIWKQIVTEALEPYGDYEIAAIDTHY